MTKEATATACHLPASKGDWLPGKSPDPLLIRLRLGKSRSAPTEPTGTIQIENQEIHFLLYLDQIGDLNPAPPACLVWSGGQGQMKTLRGSGWPPISGSAWIRQI